jgi:hypothetical protein
MKTIPFLLLVLALPACALLRNFSQNVWRTEQSAVNLVYGAYQGYTNGIVQKLSAQQSNDVRSARLKFAASVATLDAWRSAYDTNSALKPQLQAALDAALENSSNIVYLVNLYKQ